LKDNTALPIYHAWQGIVSDYSGRNLTKIGDKLTALSGLARLVAESLSIKPEYYVAGLWKDDLASGLLWYIIHPKEPNRALPYRAPTWSWASVNGKISYFHEQYQFLFKTLLKIHNAHCSPSPLDPFGRVTSGQISATGILVYVSLHICPNNPNRTKEYTGKGGCARYPYSDQFSWVCLHPTPQYPKPYFYEVLLDDRMEAESLLVERYACLLVGKHWDSKTGGCRTWWLVLRQTLRNENYWERIGIGYFHEYSRILRLFNGKAAKKTTVIII